MCSTGLLVVSNVKNVKSSITAVKKYVKNLYIHLNVPPNTGPPRWSMKIAKVYSESLVGGPELDVRVLVSPLKSQDSFRVRKSIDILYVDGKFPDLGAELREKYKITSDPIYLSDSTENDLKLMTENEENDTDKMFNSTVLGGTFDRIHVGHKILLTEAVLRAKNRLVVGVTAENMVKSKKLWELILPVEQRIKDVEDFLNDIDSSLRYEVVPIDNPFGPTQYDPNLDLIIVSAETLRGGQKVNEVRKINNLNPLEIHCIELVQELVDSSLKESKISSSNARMDLLGTRIKPIEPRPNLPPEPYIIGLTGGIASGKSKMADRFTNKGAFVIDCDKLAHEMYEPGMLCYEKIIQNFGKEILDNDQRIDRQKLGAIVFSSPKKLDVLTSIVWPELILAAKARIQEAYQKYKFRIAILEAAVLLKANWQEECHEVWSMMVPPEEAIRRLKIRNHLSEEEAQKRLDVQLDNKTIVSHSNVVFSSEFSYEFTQEQFERAWTMISKYLDSR